MTHTLLLVLFGIIMVPGLLMAFVPMLPAFWYMLACAAVFGIIDGFAHLTLANLGVLFGLFLLSIAVDWSAGLLGAKLGGAGWKSLLYGVLGGVVGLFVFPPLGIFAGLFVGVVLGELARRRSREEAIKAAAGALIGSLTGIVINSFLALTFIVLFLFFALV